MHRAENGDDLLLGRQGDGAGDLGLGALGGLDDGFGCLVDELVDVYKRQVSDMERISFAFISFTACL